MSSKYYQQYQALRDVSGIAFPNGQIRFRMELDSSKRWLPHKSFFRIKCKLEDGNGQPLDRSSGIVPNIFAGDALWQQMEVRINGTCVNKQDDYCHQIAALKTRMRKSKQWMDSTGETLNFTEADIGKKMDHFYAGGGLSMDNAYAGSITIPSIVALPTSEVVPIEADHINEHLPKEGNEYSIQNFPGDMTEDPYSLITFRQNTGPEIKSGFQIGEWIYITEEPGDPAAGPPAVVPIAPAGTQIYDIKDNRTRDPAVSPSDNNIQLKCRPQLPSETPGNGAYRAVQAQQQIDIATTVGSTSSCLFTKVKAVKDGGRGLRQYELIWQPCMGLFTDVNKVLPAADYEIILTPNVSTAYKRLAIESVHPAKVKGQTSSAANEFDFSILNIELYCAIQEVANESKESTFELDFKECRCQAQTLNTNSLVQKNFVVHRNTKELTVAYQDNALGNTNTTRSLGRFKIRENRELNLIRMYIQFRGVTLPVPQPDIEYAEDQTEFILQRWAESELYASYGAGWGGKESIQDWIKRGPYYHFNWPEKASKATEVIISSHFSKQFLAGGLNTFANTDAYIQDEERPQLLLFDHFIRSFDLKMEGGKVKRVIERDI